MSSIVQASYNTGAFEVLAGGVKKSAHLKAIISKLHENLDTSMNANGLSTKQPNEGSREVSKKRKATKVDANFKMVHAHNETTFYQKLTANAKYLHIAAFLMEFILCPHVSVKLTLDLV